MLYRAMSLTTTSGGFAVPFVLDPTLIPTSNGAVNPYRQISNVIQITVDEWRGVSSGGVTPAFQAEAAATTDASPTLAQPTVSTEMARATIPYSIEIGMDWGSFASEMANDIQDGKDVLEATKFAVGSGTNEPFGVVTGATTVFTAADTDSLVLADIYSWHNALPPRFRNAAVATFNNNILDKIRQIDTAGGSGMLQPNIQLRSAAQVASFVDGRAGVDLFGHPVYEASGQSAAMTTGQLIGVIGDYGRYYKIVDRVGLSIVDAGYAQDATSGLPTGQKFLFAYWRVGAKVLSANAFRTLKLA
jgi:HK97 family phage major capsid protein